jgi:hypothetical protein
MAINRPGHEHSAFPLAFTLQRAFGPHSFSQTFTHFLFLQTNPASGQSELPLGHSPSTFRMQPFLYGSPTCFGDGHLQIGPFSLTSQIAEGWQLLDVQISSGTHSNSGRGFPRKPGRQRHLLVLSSLTMQIALSPQLSLLQMS